MYCKANDNNKSRMTYVRFTAIFFYSADITPMAAEKEKFEVDLRLVFDCTIKPDFLFQKKTKPVK